MGGSSTQVVLDYLAAQGRADGPAIEALTSDELIWEPPPSLFPKVKGRSAVLAAMARAGAESFDLSTLEVDVHKVIADGDSVVVLQSMRGKTVSGRDYSNTYCWVYTVEHGRVTRMQEFADSLRFQRALSGDVE